MNCRFYVTDDHITSTNVNAVNFMHVLVCTSLRMSIQGLLESSLEYSTRNIRETPSGNVAHNENNQTAACRAVRCFLPNSCQFSSKVCHFVCHISAIVCQRLKMSEMHPIFAFYCIFIPQFLVKLQNQVKNDILREKKLFILNSCAFNTQS